MSRPILHLCIYQYKDPWEMQSSRWGTTIPHVWRLQSSQHVSVNHSHWKSHIHYILYSILTIFYQLIPFSYPELRSIFKILSLFYLLFLFWNNSINHSVFKVPRCAKFVRANRKHIQLMKIPNKAKQKVREVIFITFCLIISPKLKDNLHVSRAWMMCFCPESIASRYLRFAILSHCDVIILPIVISRSFLKKKKNQTLPETIHHESNFQKQCASNVPAVMKAPINSPLLINLVP